MSSSTPTPTPTPPEKKQPRYKWSHASEWLQHHLEKDLDREDLANLARELASKLDGDEIQDLFQSVMDEDGYFLDLNNLECPDCKAPLTTLTTISWDGEDLPGYCETCDREIDGSELGVPE